MNKQITIVILLFEENISTVLECLKSIKDFKIIIVDNAGDQNKKKEITSRFNIYKYIDLRYKDQIVVRERRV